MRTFVLTVSLPLIVSCAPELTLSPDGSGGTGTNGGSGGTYGGGGEGGAGGDTPKTCVDPTQDCPPTGDECVEAVCNAGACTERNAAEGTPVASQPTGMCVEQRCDGHGSAVEMPVAERAPCAENGGTVCDGAGACIGCIDGMDCPSRNCEDSSCVGTCESPNVVAIPPSCASGDSGAGNNCGPTNTSCCDNKLVPCGTYMRSYDGVAFTDDSYPATVSDFRLDTYEITVGRFRAFVNASQGTQANPPTAGAGAHPEIPGSGWDPAWNGSLAANTAEFKSALNPGVGYCLHVDSTWTDVPGSNEKLPINCVTWYEAFAFCAWDGGRLPTEAEWNYAAAGGNQQREYPWGSGFDSSRVAYGTSGVLTVGSKSPQGDGVWGQSDLAGNVREWALDWHSATYNTPCNDCANTIIASERVLRGGCFGCGADLLRAARRNALSPSFRDRDNGARCARDP